MLAIIILAGLIGWAFVFPDVSILNKENPKKTAFMEFREDEWRREGKKYKVVQRWVGLSKISPYLVKAVLIAEDDKFYMHEGFDFEGMKTALEKDFKKKQLKAGGSTISQQLAKNIYLSPSKNPVRKIREAIITWRIERAVKKSRILELYLNVAEWGEGGIFGIESASNHYYGKSAIDLSPEESARLASILPNPRKYNPLAEKGYVKNRAEIIMQVMRKRGVIPEGFEGVEDVGTEE